jgi:periplasmic divalent cation tolerance protein
MCDAILVFIMCANEGEANAIASALLDRRLLAGVNRIPAVRSEFWWLGSRQSAEEVLLLGRSRRERWSDILLAVREHHSYRVFGAYAVPIIEGNPEYLEWIQESVAPSPPLQFEPETPIRRWAGCGKG